MQGRGGAMRVLEQISAGSSTGEVCAAVKSAGLPPLDALGPEHMRSAAEHWRLCRMGLVTELPAVLKELAALPTLEYLLSLGHDLSAQPLGQAWSPGHPLRVARIARLLATVGIEHAIRWKMLRWSARPTESGLDGLLVGALFHDLGKLLVSAEILTKPGMLSDQEAAQLQEHPRLGFQALHQVAWPWPEVLTITLHHHEKWDGTGYPDGLTGEDIPWEAQIVAISDFCDSLRTARPYRTALHPDQVAAALRGQSGAAFNPVLVRTLLSIWDQIEELL